MKKAVKYTLFGLLGLLGIVVFAVGWGLIEPYFIDHVLPELSQRQGATEEVGKLGLVFLEHQVYVVALLGLGLFYGLELTTAGRRYGLRDMARVQPRQGKFRTDDEPGRE